MKRARCGKAALYGWPATALGQEDNPDVPHRAAVHYRPGCSREGRWVKLSRLMVGQRQVLTECQDTKHVFGVLKYRVAKIVEQVA